MKDKFITEQNRYAINLLEAFGYNVNFNAPTKALQETTTITITKTGHKAEFLASNLLLTKDYAVKFIEVRSFDEGHAKGKEDIINNFKTLLQL